MAEVVRMPKLSDTMTEGVVAEWHKQVGDHVDSGDLLAEIETDKATMEFESFQEGVLLHIGVDTGQTAPVDSILAILGEKGEDVSAILEAEKANPGGGSADSASDDPSPAPQASPAPQEAPAATAAAPAPAPVQASAPAPVASNGRIKASPLARKLAEDKGIDLSQVQGSGEGGRIVKRDVDSFTPAVSAGVPSTAAVGVESFHDEPVSQMRKAIARRLGESKFSAPHFYLTVEIDMDRVIDARKSINALGEVKLSFNDFVIRATAAALRKHPQVNASWMGDHIRYNDHVHMGVAVAVPDGLMVPVVRFADSKPMSQISAEVRDYAERARNKKLKPEESDGGTFSISNLGMFGIEEFTAIINPPNACILAVGNIVQKPVVKDGQIVVGNRMKVTLSCDHRVVDGATGAEFLRTFQQMMENPVLIIA